VAITKTEERGNSQVSPNLILLLTSNFMVDYYTKKRQLYLKELQENRLRYCGMKGEKEKAVMFAFLVLLLGIALFR
jgi:hypothetical protein